MNRLGFGIGLAGVLLFAPPVRAEFYQELFRGFQLAATPSGGPTFINSAGFQVNGARAGRVRIVPNRFGNGHRFELDRIFGNDATGRPEVFDLGNLELELSGALSMTGQYTARGIPTASGQSNITNMVYSFRGKTGGQDFELSGTLDMTNQFEVNPFGFYEVAFEFNQTNSQIDFEGLAIDGDRDTDFDIGPISVKGNIFFDAIVAVLASFGVDTADLEGVFPKSPIDRVTEEIRNSLEKQAEVLGQQVLNEQMVGRFGEALENGHGQARSETAASAMGPVAPANQAARGSSNVPEPGTLALFALLGLTMLARRR